MLECFMLENPPSTFIIIHSPENNINVKNCIRLYCGLKLWIGFIDISWERCVDISTGASTNTL